MRLRLLIGQVTGWPLLHGPECVSPVTREFKQDVEFARPQHFLDRGIHVAKHQPAAPLPGESMQGHEVSQGGRAREAYAAQVDDDFQGARDSSNAASKATRRS